MILQHVKRVICDGFWICKLGEGSKNGDQSGSYFGGEAQSSSTSIDLSPWHRDYHLVPASEIRTYGLQKDGIGSLYTSL